MAICQSHLPTPCIFSLLPAQGTSDSQLFSIVAGPAHLVPPIQVLDLSLILIPCLQLTEQEVQADHVDQFMETDELSGKIRNL